MNVSRWLTANGSGWRVKRVLFILWGLYIVSRVAYYTAGVRFAGSWIRDDCMSIVPYELLQTELFTSVWHFHAQPPLFSLFCGIVVKLFGGSEAVIVHLLYIIAGIVLVGTMYSFMVSLGIPYRLAGILTALFSISPDSILYENIILYTYPVAIMLLLSGLTLYKYVKTGKGRWGACTYALWGLLVLTRSMFHLVWFAAGILVVMVLSPRRWKQTILLATVPFLLTFGWYVKNYIEFGFFGSSSWIGMNVAKITMNVLTEEEKIDLAQKGVVSELVFLQPFPSFWQFKGNINVPHADSTGITVLDYQYTASGFSNYNNMVYLSLSRQLLKDDLSIIRHYPAIYLFRGLKKSFALFFAPANTWFNIWWQNRDYEQNFYRIKTFTHMWNVIFAGDFSRDYDTIGWFILLIYLSVILYWPSRFIRAASNIREHTAFYTVTIFMLMTIIYIALIGNMLELGENMRFRFNIDPFALTLFGLLISDLIRSINTRFPQSYSIREIHSKPRKKH